MSEDFSYKLKKKSKTFVDLSLSFIPSALTDDVTTLKNIRSINNSLKNIIMFMPGEVPFNHDMGSNVYRYLFDVPDDVTSGLLEDEIERAILFCEPRVSFFKPANDELVGNVYNEMAAEMAQNQIDDQLGVKVVAIDGDNGFEVTVRYRIVGSNQIIRVQEILTPTR